MPVTLLSLDCIPIAQEVIARLEPRAALSKLSLALASRADEVQVQADSELLPRILQNLIGNAMKHTPPGTSIEVGIEHRGEHVSFVVDDDGPGIPVDMRERIFDKFFQIEGEHKAGYGAGLGLAFCKMAVEAHGGCIGVESEVDAGSTFWFELPAEGGGQ